MQTDSKKIEAVLSWPIPQTVKQLRSFLGLTGYCSRFVKNYEQLAKPLTELIKKESFTWKEATTVAFGKSKSTMVSAPVLVLPDFSKTFVVETDASGEGIGVVLVLMQEGHPLAYISKAFSFKNKCLSTYEKEMLAALLTIKYWEHYLLSRHFIIRTNHKSLQFLLDQKMSTSAQHAWLIKLQPFDYEIQCRQGSENRAVDALLRRPTGVLAAITTQILSDQLMVAIKAS